ncbi:F-box-like protein [Medicago truncatula]|uniref:F-box-like protein n=1 Tax=Medicago truncatula TaxID=3880 RepID=G7L169_MEDTR|nr:F-box-like protein [Medicago truncatula]
MCYQSPTTKIAAESLAILPEKLLMEMLSYLPLKTLIRFKCVSHSWKELIPLLQFWLFIAVF